MPNKLQRTREGYASGWEPFTTCCNWPPQQASVLNRDQDLSGIRVGLHDEIFHDGKRVLAGVDAASTYCYLLVAAQHCDANTWGMHRRGSNLGHALTARNGGTTVSHSVPIPMRAADRERFCPTTGRMARRLF